MSGFGSLLCHGFRYRRLFVLLTFFGAVLPATTARATALGLAAETDLLFIGLSEIIWSVTDVNPRNPDQKDKTDYALYGKTFPGSALGANAFLITNKNIYIGIAGCYRDFPGEFQQPRFQENVPVRFHETSLVLRLGYVDFYTLRNWKILDFDDALPANAFGHIRLGFIESDISSSPNFHEFKTADIGFAGLEFGGLFIPVHHFFFSLSGCLDYTFTVDPYARSQGLIEEKIYNNVLLISIGGQFGFISDEP